MPHGGSTVGLVCTATQTEGEDTSAGLWAVVPKRSEIKDSKYSGHWEGTSGAWLGATLVTPPRNSWKAPGKLHKEGEPKMLLSVCNLRKRTQRLMRKPSPGNCKQPTGSVAEAGKNHFKIFLFRGSASVPVSCLQILSQPGP